MRSNGIWIALMAAALPAGVAPAEDATETRITVRALSKDAKFIATSMGGARVTIADADTGEVLARGVTAGSTGDTDRILGARERGGTIATEGSGKFEAVLHLDAPRRVKITAAGPLAQLQTGAEASTTLWMVPGKHLTGGDGVVLELTGFALDVLSPAAHSKLGAAPQDVEIAVNLVLL